MLGILIYLRISRASGRPGTRRPGMSCVKDYIAVYSIMTARENTQSIGGGGTYISTKANKARMQHGHLWNIL